MTTSGTSTYDPENYHLRTFYEASAQFKDGSDTPGATSSVVWRQSKKKNPWSAHGWF